jgi:choline dehydrogenase-like flavoprotein
VRSGTLGPVNILLMSQPVSVLVLEYGYLESNPDILLPAIGLTNFLADMYNYTSIPQPGMANQTAVLRLGALVGGGSAVNSMFFDRGSAEDYDNWEKLGNSGWGWDGILPHFQKEGLPSLAFQDEVLS